VILTNNTLATSSPGFADEENNNFHLMSTSSQIDAGIFVMAVTSNSGTGVSFTVEDASWFHDRFGTPGELGDLIQFEGQNHRVRIVSIYYSTNTLTVAQSISWEKDQE